MPRRAANLTLSLSTFKEWFWNTEKQVGRCYLASLAEKLRFAMQALDYDTKPSHIILWLWNEKLQAMLFKDTC